MFTISVRHIDPRQVRWRLTLKNQCHMPSRSCGCFISGVNLNICRYPRVSSLQPHFFKIQFIALGVLVLSCVCILICLTSDCRGHACHNGCRLLLSRYRCRLKRKQPSDASSRTTLTQDGASDVSQASTSERGKLKAVDRPTNGQPSATREVFFEMTDQM